MKKVLPFILLFITVNSFSQVVRKYSNEFLNIGVDAASLAMANAVTASSADVNSGYWNPAGLVALEDNELALMHASYFANIALYDYAAFATPLDDRSALGISLIRFGVDDILNTTQLIDANGNIDYNRISLFSTADYALTLSYARELPVQGLKVGANAKVIRRIIGDFASSWGFGLDVGLQFTKGNWNFGLMARDITTSVNTWSINEEEFAKISNAVADQNQDLPETLEITIPKLQLGINRNWEINYDYTIKAEVDLLLRFTQTNDIFSSASVSASPAAGFEFGYTGLVFLRAGVGNFQEITQLDGSNRIGFQPNIGVGFQYKGIHIDYALTDIGDQSAAIYSNIFSLKLDWELFR
ncbi:PorV/PorQ family protein [Leeuwenhoekiella sp. LLG6367-2.1]|uniref:putative type IX sorting system protein PorV2 n=1 Tax=Leeuwenhoekiella sp. LLG6367-2.1 TaxID=3160833 RepID=UPI00386AFFAE